MSEGISFADWERELGDIVPVEDDEGQTMRELAEHFGVNRRTMQDRLLVLSASGRCAKGWAHREIASGQSRRVPVYRLIEKGEK